MCDGHSHCGFNFHLSDGYWCWSCFHMSLGPLYVLLEEGSVQFFCPFFNWVFFLFLEWSCVSSLYNLEVKPVSEVSLANMFSHIVHSLFMLMLFSLVMAKLFILMRSNLFIFPFCSLFYVTHQWRCCCIECLKFSWRCSPLGLLWCHHLYVL